MTRRSLAVAALLALTVPHLGCRKHTEAALAEDAGAPLVVRDSSEGLLLTWIDEKGDFHVEQKTSDVPLVGRDAVRVVDPNREEGTHDDRVFVADLRVVAPDGTYPVHTMTRDDYDALAVTRRAKNAPTLAAAAAPDAGAPPEAEDVAAAAPGPAGSAHAAAGRPTVIVYGAKWCGACHQAEAYLKKHGVSYVEKDIETDPGADSEMRGKLRRAGLQGGSIPVLDVRGRIMVGFDPRQVEAALGSPI
jgi:glutaredoxin